MKRIIITLNALCLALVIHAQTSLPVIYINGNFGYEYQSGTVSLYMPNGTFYENLTGKLKWRGGSTNAANKHKRNYTIKFDEDQQFFGFRSDNKWILDAGQADLFRVRNRIATELWNDMAHKPYYSDKEPDALTGVRGQIVELYLNNEYRGIYCLTECMDRKEMKLKKFDKNTGEIRGGLWKSEGYGASLMWDVPPAYDNYSDTWDTFEVKYPEVDDLGETDYSTLWNAINFVVTSTDNEFREHIAEYFDIPVIIDYFIFINVLNAFDNVGKNMFWAVYDKTTDKKLTPAVWDLDGTVGQKWIENYIPDACSPEFDFPTHINLTYRLSKLNVDGFNEKVINRYHELRQNVLSTEQLIARYNNYYNIMNESGAAEREENLWSEDSDIDGNELNFQKEIAFITDWLNRHMTYLDTNVFSTSTVIKDIVYSKEYSAVYNLSGKRIKNFLTLDKGIYIQNGKKFIVR